MAKRRAPGAHLTVAAVCVAAGIALISIDQWTTQITAGGQPHALWRAVLPGVDIGIDAWPAMVGQGGSVEVWAYPHDAEDYLPLLRLPGAPAWPRPWQPGEGSA